MKQSQEAAPETEAQSDGGLRLILQRCIIQLQLLQRIPKLRILGSVRRIDTAEHHGSCLLVARKCLSAGPLCIGDGITHGGFLYIFQTGSDITYHSGGYLILRDELAGTEDTNLNHVRLSAGLHHPDPLSFSDDAVKDTAENDDSLIGIV